MDVQHSTAPLLRQLESTERQNRARAAAWAEVETKLRSDLEDHVIRLEKITKERNDLVTNDRRAQRYLKERDEEIASLKGTIDSLSATIESLESNAENLDAECNKTKQELMEAERKASEGISKVRSEMMQTMVDNEDRYRAQIEILENELDGERQRKVNMEKQLDDLAESMAAAEFAHNRVISADGNHLPAKEKKLRMATDQASILQDTLAGFDSDVDDDEGEKERISQVHEQGSSFAAMEQLSLCLKGARVELDTLRKQLKSSEETRESLLEELGEARQAVEKLPLFEQKVSDLTMEVRLKELEIQGLRDDIADVRFLYRTQLDALLEEKALTPVPSMKSEEDDANQVVTVVYDSN
jgi:chromosome segregation ATPase